MKQILVTAALLSMIATAGFADRIALLIGVANYRVAPLESPISDITEIGERLEGLGWATVILADPSRMEAASALREFAIQASRLSESDLALVYFSGHGFQVMGDSYLGFDGHIASIGDLLDVSISLDDITELLAESKAGKILLIDACRNNPLLSEEVVSISSGLTQITAPANTAIGFATAPHQYAYDGINAADLSPYAAAISASLSADISLDRFFRTVRRHTIIVTDGAQTPWETSSILYDYALADNVSTDYAADAPAELAEVDFLLPSEITEATVALETTNTLPEGEDFAVAALDYILTQLRKAPLEDFYIWEDRAPNEQDRSDVIASVLWDKDNRSPQLFWSILASSLKDEGLGFTAACRTGDKLDFSCGDFDRRIYVHTNPEFIFNVALHAAEIGGRTEVLAEMYRDGVWVTQDYLRAYDIYQENFGRQVEIPLDEYTEVEIVRMMQSMLNGLGSDLSVDGDFGPASCSALKKAGSEQSCAARIERETIAILARKLAAR